MTFKEIRNGQAFQRGMIFMKIDENHVFSINLSENIASHYLEAGIKKVVHLEWKDVIKKLFRSIAECPRSVFEADINPDMNVLKYDWTENDKELYDYIMKMIPKEIIDLI